MAHRPRIVVVCDEFGRSFNVSPDARRRLAALGELVEISTEAPDAGDRVRAALPAADALLVAGWETPVPRLDEAELRRLDRLAFIGCHQYNRWRFLDAGAAARDGRVLVDGSGAMAPAVAEFGLALILCALRDIPRHHMEVAGGGWDDRFQDGDPRGGELRGRKVGLVGFGSIARGLRELLRPFGCPVAACSRHLDERTAAQLGVEPMSLDRLMEWADVVVVAQSPGAGNRHLVGPRAIGRMRAGALLVSLSRGWLVDTGAVLERLRAGELKFAADVFEQEPLPGDHPLRGMANVVHTPHVAGRTLWASRQVFDAVVDDLERHVRGEPVEWAAR
jgi:phosphoglycerate dehydrogenase-like enzyme